jgi:cell division inhibitor SepF
MANTLRKAMLYLGLGPDEEYEEYEADEERPSPAPAPVGTDPAMARASADPRAGQRHEPSPVRAVNGQGERKPRATAVRPVPASLSAKPSVVAPTSFNQAQEVADKYMASQPVIVNIQGLDKDLSRRIIDFASGLCYGLGGQMEKVASQVYLLTPTNVEVSAEDRRRLEERGYDA